MDTTLLYTVVTLCMIGALASIVLYFVSQKFKVYEDPRIDEVEKALPGANCGGCGFPGCRGFAEKVVKSDDMQGLLCPVAGGDTMLAIADMLGRTASAADPMLAVVRCGGSCQKRPTTSNYDGEQRCAVAASLYGGDTGCSYGCLGLGDCVTVCKFDAIYINPETKLPEVVEDKCTACGACVKACPKIVIELRKKGMKSRRVFVSCINKDKGGVAMKACKAACIGCSKCKKECPFEAIVIENNLAYIDYNKCKLCKKCVAACPTGAILTANFPIPKPKVEVAPKAATVEKPVLAEKTAETPNSETAEVAAQSIEPQTNKSE